MRIGYHRHGKKRTERVLHEGQISVARNAEHLLIPEEEATYTLSIREVSEDGTSFSHYATITGAELARLCRIRDLNARNSRPS